MEAFVKIIHFNFYESHWKHGSHETVTYVIDRDSLSDFENVFNLIFFAIDEMSYVIHF